MICREYPVFVSRNSQKSIEIMDRHLSLFAIFVIFTSCAIFPSRADNLYIWAEENLGDVYVYYEGSIDLSGFPSPVRESGGNRSSFSAAQGNISFVAMPGIVDSYAGVIPNYDTRTFGTGAKSPDIEQGHNFGFRIDFSNANADDLLLPPGYVSGTKISGNIVLFGTTLAALGVDTTPFSFKTLPAGGLNTIHMFTDPALAAAERARLLMKIKKLEKKSKKARKKGKKKKAKKLKKKLKEFKKELAALDA